MNSKVSKRLRRSDCADSGIERRGHGRGFVYRDADGERIDDEETMARIRGLGIPPAWREVWICPDPLGHIQATGLDAAGRKQYLSTSAGAPRQYPRCLPQLLGRSFARPLRLRGDGRG